MCVSVAESKRSSAQRLQKLHGSLLWIFNIRAFQIREHGSVAENVRWLHVFQDWLSFFCFQVTINVQRAILQQAAFFLFLFLSFFFLKSYGFKPILVKVKMQRDRSTAWVTLSSTSWRKYKIKSVLIKEVTGAFDLGCLMLSIENVKWMKYLETHLSTIQFNCITKWSL